MKLNRNDTASECVCGCWVPKFDILARTSACLIRRRTETKMTTKATTTEKWGINEIDVNILNKTFSCLKNIVRRKKIFYIVSLRDIDFREEREKNNTSIRQKLNGKEWKWWQMCDDDEARRQSCHTILLFVFLSLLLFFHFGQFRSGFSSVSTHSYGCRVPVHWPDQWQENVMW